MLVYSLRMSRLTLASARLRKRVRFLIDLLLNLNASFVSLGSKGCRNHTALNPVLSREILSRPAAFGEDQGLVKGSAVLVTIEVNEFWGLSELLGRLASTQLDVTYRLVIRENLYKSQVMEIVSEIGIDFEKVFNVDSRTENVLKENDSMSDARGAYFLGFFRTSSSPVLSERYLWELDLLLGPPGWVDYVPRLLDYLRTHGSFLSVLDLDNQEMGPRALARQFSVSGGDGIDPSRLHMYWTLSDAKSPAGDLGKTRIGRLVRRPFAKGEKHILLVAQDKVTNWRTYEEQRFFTPSQENESVRVLAYYLPQFYETEENNEWWGPGFTEWTNVRAAEPLYLGHEQGKLPHSSIGQYRLDDADTLRKQANLMKHAGISGLIFYHYWFSGRRILEKPVQILYSQPDIQIPFCFCWANENWTRKWDGNDSEVLLSQEYSETDARDFIRTLIPFFRDSRYLTVDGRPLIFIYRPALFPDAKTYIRAWEEECRQEGVPTPYVVTVLTRDSAQPESYGADAGAERVLFDWTGGAVRDIKAELHQFSPMSGSVLSYDDVARHYELNSPMNGETPIFRSLIPGWDNSARYGSEAYVVDGPSPARFETWLSNLIHASRKTSAKDERIVIVNAWNEWAEGAYLEPDMRNGFAYLNSVGRALAGQPTPVDTGSLPSAAAKIAIIVEFSSQILQQKDRAPQVEDFLDRLQKAAAPNGWNVVQEEDPRPETSYVTLFVKKLGFFGDGFLPALVRTALDRGESIVVPQEFWPFEFELSHNALQTIPEPFLDYSSVLAYSGATKTRNRTKTVVLEHTAKYFPASETRNSGSGSLGDVTALVRVHLGARLDLLEDALFSLAAQIGCNVRARVLAQGFYGPKLHDLEELISRVQVSAHLPIEVQHFPTKGEKEDLRSEMLNRGLREAETRFVTILDYDDVLYDGAYAWLLSRIEQTGKAVALGRVFETCFEDLLNFSKHNRPTFTEKGTTFKEFLSDNFIPIHSLMFDTTKVSFNETTFHPNQIYMEDYYLLLQVLTPFNTDWEGLQTNRYIASYRHLASGRNTLGLDKDRARALAFSSEYLFWERKVFELRRTIQSRHATYSAFL